MKRFAHFVLVIFVAAVVVAFVFSVIPPYPSPSTAPSATKTVYQAHKRIVSEPHALYNYLNLTETNATDSNPNETIPVFGNPDKRAFLDLITYRLRLSASC